jgi:hypothetical protein
VPTFNVGDDASIGADDVGFDDAATLLEPAPHIPDSPDVASIPDVIVTPDVADIADDVDIPDGIALPGGAAAPAAIPPPSYVVGDPNVPGGEVATVEHAAPLLAFGTVIVPVSPLGTVLAAGAAPSGNPFGPIDSLGATPSEEVTPGEGIVVAIPAWANAGLLAKKGNAAATISNGFMGNFLQLISEGLRCEAAAAAAEPAEAVTLRFHCTRSQRIKSLCITSEPVDPLIPALPAPATLPAVAPGAPGRHAAMSPGWVAVLFVVGKTLGIAGIEEPSARVLAIGNGLGSGTAGAELTPRLAVDPYNSEGEVATVEHAVPPLVVGIAIVPAKPVGAGLTPAELISVEPSGIPVGELAEAIVMPSGAVAPTMGVGVTASPTWAMARLPPKNAKKSAATSATFTGFKFASPRRSGFRTISPVARLSDIGQSMVSSAVNAGCVERRGVACEVALQNRPQRSFTSRCFADRKRLELISDGTSKTFN